MKVTHLLILANILVFIAQMLSPLVDALFSLTPYLAVHGYVWQVFTSMFLHGSPMHIFFNMFGLLIFGTVVEELLGWKRYIFLYLLSGIGSSLLYAGLSPESMVPMVGASGAIFGVMAAYAFMFPKNIIFIFPGIPLPSAVFVILFALFSLFSGILGFAGGIAHWGHLGGIITGFLLMFYWSKGRKKRPDREIAFFFE